jgi:hypothetical protein
MDIDSYFLGKLNKLKEYLTHNNNKSPLIVKHSKDLKKIN